MASFSLLRALLTHFEAPDPLPRSAPVGVRHEDDCNMFRGGFCDCIPAIESATELVHRAARRSARKRRRPPAEAGSKDLRLFQD
jgi:hypothetical protein